MTTLETLIKQRRSIRKYKSVIPPDAWIESMILAAARAPSPRNSQPVRFLRIQSPEALDNLRQAMNKGRDRLLRKSVSCERPKKIRNWINAYWRYSEFLFHAPVLFAVGTIPPIGSFSDQLRQAGLIGKTGQDETDMDISVGLALKGFILKGQELGLGTCILTAPLTFIRDTKKILDTGDIGIKCFMTVGFPDEIPAFPDTRRPADIYGRI